MSQAFSHNDYHVAWISALPLEAAAARVILEREHPTLQQPPGDHNSYILGEVLGHNVVIACLPSYGTVSATAAVVQLRSTFNAIDFALMVGIGGAVPSQANDIRLGDVVVSKPVGTFGGVVQYDFGKSIQEEPFKRLGTLDKPPQFLLAAMANLESRYMVGEGQLKNIVSNALEKSVAIKAAFKKPEHGMDQLYRSDYGHVLDHGSCACCSSDQLVKRVNRNLDEPQVYCGLIASGNRVMKDGRERDQLADLIPGILCFEMEAAGLMDHMPSLVIRGICDYSDSHKNKDWQPYAALTAAAYAKELLSTISNKRYDKDCIQPSKPSKPSLAVFSLLKEHFEKFKETVYDTQPEDAIVFTDSKAEDVYQTARDIEKELEGKGCLRNMRRITSFLDALSRFKSQLAEIEDMSSYLSWIMAPIIRALQIASKHVITMEKLISAYDRITPVLSRFENAQKDWVTDQYGVSIMVLIFVNIIDLHLELYRLLNNKSTAVFHVATWSRFERRLRLIVDNCAEYCERLYSSRSSETSASEMVSRGRKALNDLEESESQQSIRELQATISWVRIEEDTQDNEVDRLHSLKHQGSCGWIFNNKKLRSWFRMGHDESIIWLTGIPGAGKSVLAATIVQKMKTHGDLQALYYFCGSQGSNKPASSLAFHSFVAQAARASPECASYIYQEHIQKGHSPSIIRMKGILEFILPAMGSARIVLDGVDELSHDEQTKLLKSILPLSRSKDGRCICKLIILSRDIANVSFQMSRVSRIDLNHERRFRDIDIQSFILDELTTLRISFEDIDGDGELLGEIEDEMIEKADGMFLWVRLVLSSIRNVRRLADLRDIVHTLPKGLENMYGRIVQGMFENASESDKMQTEKILSWALFGVQPLRTTDILHGASIDPGNPVCDEGYRLRTSSLDLCKPLLEERGDGTVRFIHSTVHQFFVKKQGTRFIDPTKAHFAIAFACTAYLAKGLDLLYPELHPDQQRNEFLQGDHGLCRYARENWSYHLQQYSDKMLEVETEEPQLLQKQIRIIYEKHRSLENYYPNFHQSHEIRTPHIAIENMRLPFLQDFPDIAEFVQTCSAFQSRLKTQVFSSGEDIDKYVYQHDPSLFGRMLQTYNTIVQELSMPNSADPVLAGRRLARFKDQFGPSAFPCRFCGCMHAFPNSERRLDHELSRHISGIRCLDPSCSFNRIGFSSSRALRKHTMMYHGIQEERPSTLRKKYQCQCCSQRYRLEGEFRRHQQACGNRSFLAVRDSLVPPHTNFEELTNFEFENEGNRTTGVPKLSQKVSDIYQDELYNPTSVSASQAFNMPISQQQQQSLSTSTRSVFADRLKAANEGHLSARSKSPIVSIDQDIAGTHGLMKQPFQLFPPDLDPFHLDPFYLNPFQSQQQTRQQTQSYQQQQHGEIPASTPTQLPGLSNMPGSSIDLPMAVNYLSHASNQVDIQDHPTTTAHNLPSLFLDTSTGLDLKHFLTEPASPDPTIPSHYYPGDAPLQDLGYGMTDGFYYDAGASTHPTSPSVHSSPSPMYQDPGAPAHLDSPPAHLDSQFGRWELNFQSPDVPFLVDWLPEMSSFMGTHSS